MNTILQKRIEGAAKRYSVSWRKNPDGSESKEMFPVAAERCFKAGATFALQNQWISVKEALPEKRQDILVAVLDTKSNTYFFGFDNIDDDNGEFLRDKNGFAIENDYHKITHWMPIPSLKGGEE